jgi:hypothetical protein
LNALLGPATYQPTIDGIRRRLRSANKQPASSKTRETPWYLRIIASPDDEQEKRLKAEFKGDVGIVKWNVVKECAGAPADTAKLQMTSIL